MFDLAIRNGTIITADAMFSADLGIRDGRIVQVGGDGIIASQDYDARGCLVMPGGIDVHTHLEIGREGALRSADTFATGTRGAICGGTTSVIDFCQQEAGETLAQALQGWHSRAEGKAVADYGFHIIVSDFTPEVAAELDGLPDRGVTSIKLFMAYRGQQMIDDRVMLAVLDSARRSGSIVMVHAENGDAADYLIQQNLAAGRTAPQFHALSRPPRIEAEATARAIALAETVGASLYIVHVSCRESLEEVLRGRARGVDVTAETCTHYLYVTTGDLERPNFEGAKFVFSPPARSADDNRALWAALRDGRLQVLSSDHGGWSFSAHKSLGRDDFSRIPNGVPGVEERMIMAWQGVVRGEIDPCRFVEITATGPARIFGLANKGRIAPGHDADIVIWDANKTGILRRSALHHATDFSVYEGRPVSGGVQAVFLRGTLMVQEGNFVGPEGAGRYLHRITRNAGLR